MVYSRVDDRNAYMRRYYAANAEVHKARVKVWQSNQRTLTRQLVDSAKRIPCADCGIAYPSYVMDFDHVRGEKLANVSELVGRGWALERVQAEIDKCEVVCANCHRERTHNTARGSAVR